MMKPDCDEEFENEKKMYKELGPLQGRVVPIMYGEATCQGKPAILLSDVGGYALNDDDMPQVEEDDLRRMLKDAYKPLIELRIVQGDVKLGNCHFTGDRIIVLDLEQVERLEDVEDEYFEQDLKLYVKKHTARYINHRAWEEWERNGGCGPPPKNRPEW